MTDSALPRQWPAHTAPHLTGGSTHRHIRRSWVIAAALPAACGLAFYGPAALRILAIAAGVAVASGIAIGIVARQRAVLRLSDCFLIGVVLGLTLPATAPWYVPAVGSAAAIATKALLGGLGQCLWHPALVGRVVVQFIFWQHLAFVGGGPAGQAPVLARSHLFVGDITNVEYISAAKYQGWDVGGGEENDHDALLLDRPARLLRAFTDGRLEFKSELRLSTLVRDALPPWRDTVIGAVPAAIGEPCVLALIVAGLFLIYRGHLRWQMPVAILASAAVAAVILPVRTGPDSGYVWLPGLVFEEGRLVGLAYVLYQLTVGQLMIGAFLIAGDTSRSPLLARGQAVFGLGLGVLTVFLQLYGPLECAGYWAILAMNTLVPVIDRRLKRPILGAAA